MILLVLVSSYGEVSSRLRNQSVFYLNLRLCFKRRPLMDWWGFWLTKHHPLLTSQTYSNWLDGSTALNSEAWALLGQNFQRWAASLGTDLLPEWRRLVPQICSLFVSPVSWGSSWCPTCQPFVKLRPLQCRSFFPPFFLQNIPLLTYSSHLYLLSKSAFILKSKAFLMSS